MCAEPHDKNNLELVFNINDQAIIALNIEHHPFGADYAGIPVFCLQFVGIVPG